MAQPAARLAISVGSGSLAEVIYSFMRSNAPVGGARCGDGYQRNDQHLNPRQASQDDRQNSDESQPHSNPRRDTQNNAHTWHLLQQVDAVPHPHRVATITRSVHTVAMGLRTQATITSAEACCVRVEIFLLLALTLQSVDENYPQGRQLSAFRQRHPGHHDWHARRDPAHAQPTDRGAVHIVRARYRRTARSV